MQNTILYDDGVHKFVHLAWEEKEEEGIVQTNQYLIIDSDEGFLLDPGGAHVFPRVLANVSELIEPSKIKYIFFTHQDPDVTSGITLWLSIAEKANIYISALWTRFLPHFGVYDQKRVVAIPDKGERIRLKSGTEIEFIPSHYLHATGNFTLYDPRAKILFSGDIGVCVFPKGGRYLFVEDFNQHVKLMEAFHRRYMTSNTAIRKWLSIVEKKEINIVAPQHGAIFKDKNVKLLFDWLRNLKCGLDIIDEIYGR
ncbi:oxygen-binding di-iron domain-containing protein [Pseudothermotoga thermarum]|uniref:Beta-lactamase domain-containing protein n=1 Tax=Pseudothermotoga thermarum DSM 5069 TaxID=688269 RepID=F7YVI2_9THEM|nr:MBL fold metallo-hydrolase [Pseudothermotoga thermarum]AEH51637.1 beta-lactamase domain-containing protein [Pseudothermotoga thermarum DSM 5069]